MIMMIKARKNMRASMQWRPGSGASRNPVATPTPISSTRQKPTLCLEITSQCRLRMMMRMSSERGAQQMTTARVVELTMGRPMKVSGASMQQSCSSGSQTPSSMLPLWKSQMPLMLTKARMRAKRMKKLRPKAEVSTVSIHKPTQQAIPLTAKQQKLERQVQMFSLKQLEYESQSRVWILVGKQRVSSPMVKPAKRTMGGVMKWMGQVEVRQGCEQYPLDLARVLRRQKSSQCRQMCCEKTRSDMPWSAENMRQASGRCTLRQKKSMMSANMALQAELVIMRDDLKIVAAQYALYCQHSRSSSRRRNRRSRRE